MDSESKPADADKEPVFPTILSTKKVCFSMFVIHLLRRIFKRWEQFCKYKKEKE